MIRKIKTGLKIVIVIIQISLSLVSVVGLMSTTRTLSQPDNLSIDFDNSVFEISESGSEVVIPTSFNNMGAYNISQVSYRVKISMVEKPEFAGATPRRYTILDKAITGINFGAQERTNFTFEASGTDFSFAFLEPVWIQLNNQEYNFYAEFTIQGKTNLDLVSFSTYFNYTITGAVYS